MSENRNVDGIIPKTIYKIPKIEVLCVYEYGNKAYLRNKCTIFFVITMLKFILLYENANLVLGYCDEKFYIELFSYESMTWRPIQITSDNIRFSEAVQVTREGDWEVNKNGRSI